MEKKKKRIGIFLFCLLFIASIILLIYIGLNDNVKYYTIFPIIAYIIGIFINLSNFIKKENNYVLYILSVLFFIRNIIIPFLSILDGTVMSYSYDTEYIKSLYLITYETIVVFISLNIFYRIIKVKQFKKKEDINSFSFIFKIILFIVIICLLLFPALFRNYNILIQTDTDVRNEALLVAEEKLSSVPSLIRVLMVILMEPLRIFLSIYIIDILYKKYREKQSQKYINISLLIVLLNAIIMTERKLFSIIFAFCLVLFLLRLYPKSTKKILFICGVGLICVIGFVAFFKLFVIKTSLNEDNSLLKSIRAYVNSSDTNIKTAIQMKEIYDMPISDKFSLFVKGDTLASMPLIQYFFSENKTTTYLFNETYYTKMQRYDQILPLIGQSYYYLGFVLAPLASVICIVFSVFYEKKFHLQNNNYKVFLYIFIFVYLCLIPFLYNYNIMILYIFAFMIPLFLFIKLNLQKRSEKSVSKQSI